MRAFRIYRALPLVLGLLQGAASIHSQTLSDFTSLPDVTLVNQHGEKVRFMSDLVKNHVVVVNTVFTTCTTICTPLGAKLAKLSNVLKDSDGKDVRLISISVDPVTDTPKILEAWAAKFGPAHNWTLLTGPEADVKRLLKAVNLFTADKSSHSPIMILANGTTGEWSRVNGLEQSPANLADRLNKMARSLVPSGEHTRGIAGTHAH
ncbi:MAG TPA: SCO family protein [Bryobacteraceae bacterium]|nr:SCO family protein [Bryobacteraceae bacterium]